MCVFSFILFLFIYFFFFVCVCVCVCVVFFFFLFFFLCFFFFFFLSNRDSIAVFRVSVAFPPHLPFWSTSLQCNKKKVYENVSFDVFCRKICSCSLYAG